MNPVRPIDDTTRVNSGASRPARWAWRAAKLCVFGLATWLLAVPQLPKVWAALGALAGIHIVFVLAGAALAVTALMSYAQLTRTVLDDGERPGLLHAFGIIMTSLGINRVMPGGAAAGGVMTFRLLRRSGVRTRRAAFAMMTQSVGSAAILNVLLWLGLLATLPFYGFNAAHLAAVIVGGVVFGAVAVVVHALVRRRRWLWSTASWIGDRVPRLTGASMVATLDDQSARFRALAARPGTVRRAIGWATTNWLLDAAALWVFLFAFGVSMNPIVVIVAFALANIAAIVPITPGGLGVVDLALVATLTGFGAPAAQAALGVAAYRVFNYWLPIPAAALAYLIVSRITTATHRVAEAVAPPRRSGAAAPCRA